MFVHDTEIDANRNGFVDANELCVALARAGHTFVDISLARLLVKLFDSKAIGQIDFTDFLVLNRFLFQMNQVFRANDFNNDGMYVYPWIRGVLAGYVVRTIMMSFTRTC